MDASVGGHVGTLLSWDDGETDQVSRFERLVADPRFGPAARMLARNMLDATESDETLAEICKDGGRYVAALWGIYLHVSGGLTLPRLKQICAASGIMSPGRARDMLNLMLHSRHIELLSAAADGATARYTPTQTLLAAWRSHLCVALEAASLIEPGVEVLLRRFHVPGVLETYARLHAEGLLLAVQVTDLSSPYFRVFVQRHAGNHIVWTLVAAADDDEDFPSGRPLPVSVAAVARRFGVSRAHVKRLLDEAAREGLLSWCESRAVQLQESARASIRFSYAGQLVHLLIAAARTIKERPELAGIDA